MFPAALGVGADGVFGGAGEAELIEVLVGVPGPDDLALLVHDIDHVVQQHFAVDFGIAHVVVGQNQHLSVQLGLDAGRIITGGAAFKLEVMVLTGHGIGAVGIGGLPSFALVHLKPAVVLTNDIAVEVQQSHSVVVLGAAAQAGVQGGQQVTAGVYLVGHSLAAELIPFLDQVAVAVDELGRVGTCQDDVTVPGFGGVVLDGSHRNDVGLRRGHAGAGKDGAEAESQRLEQLHVKSFFAERPRISTGTIPPLSPVLKLKISLRTPFFQKNPRPDEPSRAGIAFNRRVSFSSR